MRLTFAGAAGTVTGSRYLLESGGRTALIDCGLFQGYKALRQRNWAQFPFPPHRLASVTLTHAHLDHSGYLPRLVSEGFRGPIYCTPATAALLHLLLPDSARIMEEDAEHANRRGYSKHSPALPLYTVEDAERVLRQIEAVRYQEVFDPAPHLSATLRPVGHMLGAASVHVQGRDHSILFSGDVGRPNDPIMVAPLPPPAADYLVLESTYGDRRHEIADVEERLAEVVTRTARRGGIVVIPAFAVGRVQTLLYHLYRLKAAGRIPVGLPIFLNSPMAVDATAIYHQFRREHRLSNEECAGMCHAARIIRSPEESKALNDLRMPAVIISASGMATGGRVLHHLKAFAPDARNTLLFVGYQAGGTRGALITGGAPSVRIHGQEVAIRAEVVQFDFLSAHADSDELLAWTRGMPTPPRQVFIVHGEPDAAEALRRRIDVELGWKASVAEHLEQVDL